MMPRIFIAVDIPQLHQERIFEIQNKFSTFKLKQVKQSHLHITMKFLGEVKESTVQDVLESLSGLNMAGFDASIGQLGIFPKKSSPKVLWVGADGSFTELHDAIENSLNKIAFPKDDKEFIPHITISRIKHLSKTEKKDFLSIYEKMKNIHIGNMRVNTVKLKKSVLTPSGPIYETIHEFELQ